MNNDLANVLAYMERERGIDRKFILQAVESALQVAGTRALSDRRDVRVEIDRTTCEIRVYAVVSVVEHESGGDEISYSKALKIKPDVKLGDEIEVEVTPKDFGRIAAQTAKQTIFQKIRQAEREKVFDDYKDRVGTIVSGTVRQFNRGDILVDLGHAEAVLPAKERVTTEEYQMGDRLRAYILSVQSNAPGPSIILSRSHPNFIKALFALEVSEVADGVVEIKGVAREPGYRTKVAVVSHDEKVDPVGACVGLRGARVKNIVRELSGEKIDVIRWSDDIRTYVANALSPAKLFKVVVDQKMPNTVRVIADAEQLSLAIGKRGQNVRLTARLIGWRRDVQKDDVEVSFEEKVAQAVKSLGAVKGIGIENAEKLVHAGFLTVEGILAANADDISETVGIDRESAVSICEAAAAHHDRLESGGA